MSYLPLGAAKDVPGKVASTSAGKTSFGASLLKHLIVCCNNEVAAARSPESLASSSPASFSASRSATAASMTAFSFL